MIQLVSKAVPFALVAAGGLFAGWCDQKPVLDDSPAALKGQWEVSAYRLQRDGCDPPEPARADAGGAISQNPSSDEAAERPPFDHFELRERTGEDGPSLSMYLCESKDDCAEEVAFARAEELGWTATMAGGRPDWKNVCEAEFVETRLRPTPEGVRLEYLHRRGQLVVEGQVSCDEAFVREHHEELPCVERETLAAERPTDAS